MSHHVCQTQLCKCKEKGSYEKGIQKGVANVRSWPYLAWVHIESWRCKWDKKLLPWKLDETVMVLLQTWPHLRYDRCLAEGAIMRVWESREKSMKKEIRMSVQPPLHQHDPCWSGVVCHSGTSAIERRTGKPSSCKTFICTQLKTSTKMSI